MKEIEEEAATEFRNELLMGMSAKAMRTFETGATRDSDDNKLDFEGFLSPFVLERYAQYMNLHRKQADGKLRDSDNWQHGIPLTVYLKSMWRHFFDVWKLHRNANCPIYDQKDGHSVKLDEALCAVIFNASGMLHEIMKAQYQNTKGT